MAGASGCPDHGSRSAIVPPHSTRAVLTPRSHRCRCRTFPGCSLGHKANAGSLARSLFLAAVCPVRVPRVREGCCARASATSALTFSSFGPCWPSSRSRCRSGRPDAGPVTAPEFRRTGMPPQRPAYGRSRVERCGRRSAGPEGRFDPVRLPRQFLYLMLQPYAWLVLTLSGLPRQQFGQALADVVGGFLDVGHSGGRDAVDATGVHQQALGVDDVHVGRDAGTVGMADGAGLVHQGGAGAGALVAHPSGPAGAGAGGRGCRRGWN